MELNIKCLIINKIYINISRYMSKFGKVFVKNSNFGSTNSKLVSNISAVKLNANMITAIITSPLSFGWSMV